MRSKIVQYDGQKVKTKFILPISELMSSSDVQEPMTSKHKQYSLGQLNSPRKTKLRGQMGTEIQEKTPQDVRITYRQNTKSISMHNILQLPSVNSKLSKHSKKQSEHHVLEKLGPQSLVRLDYNDSNNLLPTIRQRNPKPQQFQSEFKTKAGCNQIKVVKTNQDSVILNPKVLEKFGVSFYAVSDGHGQNGHLASQFLQRTLPSESIKIQSENLSKFLARVDWSYGDLRKALTDTYLLTNKELIQSDFDTKLSGSTTVGVMIYERRIFCANVGDSRAIMCSFVDNNWQVQALNIDHKPDYIKERNRILSKGGRIQMSYDEYGEPIGPERVWQAHQDTPGLAMTRSFGDQMGIPAGIIADPEIMEFELKDQDKFLVIGSDGLFEYLSNEQVMNTVVPVYLQGNIVAACNRLIFQSSVQWDEQCLSRDDITCVVVFLN